MISVVVLVYRNIEYLERTIKSIFMQEDVEIELFISDDGSEHIFVSDMDEIVKRMGERECIKKIVVRQNEKNIGIVAHANKVFGMSTGSVIVPLTCGDVFYHSHVVYSIQNYFMENHCLIATAKRACFSEATGADVEILPSPKQAEMIQKGGRRLINSLCRGNYISGASTYYAKELFEKYGAFDENMFLIDDYPKYLRLLFAGERIYWMDEITIRYQLGGVSTGKSNPLFDKDMQMIYDQVIVPHKKDIGFGNYRFLHCRNYMKHHSKLSGIFYCLWHPDVIAMKVFFEIQRLFVK